MLFYILTILVGTVAIILGNTFAVPFEWQNLLWNSINTVTGVVAIIALDGLFAFLIRRALPKSWFMHGKRVFEVKKGERDFYNKIKIKAWKDKVPELGGFTGFHKSEFKSSQSAEYLGRFIMEANFGEVIHLENALFGFAICFIPWCSAPSIWIPIYCVNFVLSMLPVFILRYTTYTLNRLYKKQSQKEKPTQVEEK